MDSLHSAVSDSFASCTAQFGANVCIMSNSAGTNDDVRFESAERIEQSLGVAVLRHAEKKPGGLNAVLQFFQTSTGSDDIVAADLCVIGDRLLTDVVFGNLHGMLTIHTKVSTSCSSCSHIRALS